MYRTDATLLVAVLLAGLAVATVFDIRDMRIPNWIPLSLALVWSPLSLIADQPLMAGVLSAVVVVHVLLLLRFCVRHRVPRTPSLGGGDVKLIGVVGLYLSARVFAVVFVASILALLWVTGWALVTRSLSRLRVAVPFAPFMLVAVCLVLWAELVAGTFIILKSG